MNRKRIIVYHAHYGCDTGCCGHVIEMRNTDDEIVRSEFEFMPPDDGEDKLEWAKRIVEREFGADHVADLDWDNCTVLDAGEC